MRTGYTISYPGLFRGDGGKSVDGLEGLLYQWVYM